MVNLHRLRIAAVLALAIPAFLTSAAHADTLADIKTRGEINICNGIIGLKPFLYKNASGEYTGFEYEMMINVTKRMGVPKINFIQLDWAALIPGLKSGRCDVIWSGMTMTEQRRIEGGVEFSLPYFFQDDRVVVTQDSPIKVLADLKGKSLGATVGSVEENQARSLISQGFGSEYKGFNDQKTPFLALLGKQIDAVVCDIFSFQGQYEVTPNIRMLDAVSLPLMAAPQWQERQDKAAYRMGSAGIAFRKEDTFLIAAVNEALTGMEGDGSRQAILARYNAWGDTQTLNYMTRR